MVWRRNEPGKWGDLTMMKRRITFVAVDATLCTAAFIVREDLKL
jgi:hypothetical protein